MMFFAKNEKKHHIKRLAGVTLLESMLVIAIASSIMVLSIKVYRQYETQVNVEKIRYNVDTLFQAMSQYYRAQCGGSGTIATAPTNAPYVVSMNTLAPYLPANWESKNPLITGYALQFNPVVGVAAPYINTCVVTQPGTPCTAGGSTPLSASQAQIVIWNAQVAILIANTTAATFNRYKTQLGSDCASVSNGTSINTCVTQLAPAVAQYTSLVTTDTQKVQTDQAKVNTDITAINNDNSHIAFDQSSISLYQNIVNHDTIQFNLRCPAPPKPSPAMCASVTYNLATDTATLNMYQTNLATDQAKLATDQATLAADQATLAADQATLASDQATLANLPAMGASTGDYLVWQRLPSATGSQATSTLWMTMPQLQQFNLQYTHDQMLELNQGYTSPRPYLCGG